MKRIIVLSLLVTACQSTPEPMPTYPRHPDPRLRAALPFKANGIAYQGTAVIPLPRQSSTKISVDVPKETKFLFFNTCKREDVIENPEAKTFDYTFVPGMWKENMGSCALLVTIVTKSGEYHRAVIDFTNSEGRDLVGDLFCNGRWYNAVSGAGFCQIRAEIPMSVRFDTDVIFKSRDVCPAPTCVSGCKTLNEIPVGREFDIVTGAGLCGYDFMDQKANVFRLSTLGYTSILNVFPPSIK
jgi:hypothetical protein